VFCVGTFCTCAAGQEIATALICDHWPLYPISYVSHMKANFFASGGGDAMGRTKKERSGVEEKKYKRKQRYLFGQSKGQPR